MQGVGYERLQNKNLGDSSLSLNDTIIQLECVYKKTAQCLQIKSMEDIDKVKSSVSVLRPPQPP